MAPSPRRSWQEMTTDEVAGLDARRVIALLPVAAIEQHGPHLPLSVDADIARGILDRAVAWLPETLPLTVLPMMPVGRSDEHGDFPGTLSLSPETIMRLWGEIGDGVARAGIRKLVIFNSHGGNPQMLDIVGRDLRIRHRMLVVQVNSWRLFDASGMFDADELAHGIHGGAIETSMMLHLRPELVRMEKAADFAPSSLAMAKQYRHVGPHGRVPFSWLTQDLHPSGACGDATKAEAAHGKTLVEAAARALVEILEEVDRLPPDLLKERG
jgi:creatinine amidohydrolase